MEVVVCGGTSTAPYRKRAELNQDAFRFSEFSGYAAIVVCDGVSNCLAGREAANIACDTFLSAMQRELRSASALHSSSQAKQSFSAFVLEADAAILASFQPGQAITTLSAILVEKQTGVGWWINVGDSPGYHVQEGKIETVTPMDVRSVPRMENGQTVIRDGMVKMDIAITAALGTGGGISPHIHRRQLTLGDQLIVTSDGFDEQGIQALLKLVDSDERGIQPIVSACSERNNDDASFAMITWGKSESAYLFAKQIAHWCELDSEQRLLLLEECKSDAKALFQQLLPLLDGDGNEAVQLALLNLIGRWLNRTQLISLADQAAASGHGVVTRKTIQLLKHI